MLCPAQLRAPAGRSVTPLFLRRARRQTGAPPCVGSALAIGPSPVVNQLARSGDGTFVCRARDQRATGKRLGLPLRKRMDAAFEFRLDHGVGSDFSEETRRFCFRQAEVVGPSAALRLLCHDCDHVGGVDRVAGSGAKRKPQARGRTGHAATRAHSPTAAFPWRGRRVALPLTRDLSTAARGVARFRRHRHRPHGRCAGDRGRSEAIVPVGVVGWTARLR